MRALSLGGALAVSAACGAPERSPAPAEPKAEIPVNGSSERQPVHAELCFVGAVVAREETDVAAEVEAMVASIDVRVGDQVTQGEPLAVLDTRALRHRLAVEDADLQAASAERQKKIVEAEQSRQDHERRSALAGLVSREELEASEARLRGSAASLAVAEARVAQVQARIAELRDALARSTLKAPFTGLVSRRYLDPGSRTAVGTPVLRLMRWDSLMVRFAVPAELRHELGIGRPVRAELVADGRVLNGVVEQVAPEVDPASLLLFVEAGLDVEGSGPLFGAEVRVRVQSVDENPPSCLNGLNRP